MFNITKFKGYKYFIFQMKKCEKVELRGIIVGF